MERTVALELYVNLIAPAITGERWQVGMERICFAKTMSTSLRGDAQKLLSLIDRN
jgi:hypothetical protein